MLLLHPTFFVGGCQKNRALALGYNEMNMGHRRKTRGDPEQSFGLLPREFRTLKRLRTPERIQGFLDALPINHEAQGETYRSPRRVLRDRTAHCFEGALFAAAALLVNGERPLLLDLKVDERSPDVDHVVTLFRRGPYWGAISKTNHAVLRYREPVYRSVRELAMSYFHEYFLDNGRKTLRSYSRPFDLLPYVKRGWLTDERDLHWLVDTLDNSPHIRILPRGAERRLRRADTIERATGKIVEWSKTGKRIY